MKLFHEIVEFITVDKGLSVSLKPEFFLPCAQKMATINMEKPSRMLLKHEVTRMPIPYPQNVRGDTLTSQRGEKLFPVLTQLFGLFLAAG